jgi:hypothetical protein
MAITDKLVIEQYAKQDDIIKIMEVIDKITAQVNHLSVEVEKLWAELRKKNGRK